jgi:DNA-binding transcriptional ArsR family regulator
VTGDADRASELRRLAAGWAPALHALGQEERLLIALCLASREKSVRELQDDTGLGQSLVSYHLAGLRAAGLVTACPQGRSNRYQLCCTDLDDLVRALTGLAATARAGQ